jgi:hypothetical protein
MRSVQVEHEVARLTRVSAHHDDDGLILHEIDAHLRLQADGVVVARELGPVARHVLHVEVRVVVAARRVERVRRGVGRGELERVVGCGAVARAVRRLQDVGIAHGRAIDALRHRVAEVFGRAREELDVELIRAFLVAVDAHQHDLAGLERLQQEGVGGGLRRVVVARDLGPAAPVLEQEQDRVGRGAGGLDAIQARVGGGEEIEVVVRHRAAARAVLGVVAERSVTHHRHRQVAAEIDVRARTGERADVEREVAATRGRVDDHRDLLAHLEVRDRAVGTARDLVATAHAVEDVDVRVDARADRVEQEAAGRRCSEQVLGVVARSAAARAGAAVEQRRAVAGHRVGHRAADVGGGARQRARLHVQLERQSHRGIAVDDERDRLTGDEVDLDHRLLAVAVVVARELGAHALAVEHVEHRVERGVLRVERVRAVGRRGEGVLRIGRAGASARAREIVGVAERVAEERVGHARADVAERACILVPFGGARRRLGLAARRLARVGGLGAVRARLAGARVGRAGVGRAAVGARAGGGVGCGARRVLPHGHAAVRAGLVARVLVVSGRVATARERAGDPDSHERPRAAQRNPNQGHASESTRAARPGRGAGE